MKTEYIDERLTFFYDDASLGVAQIINGDEWGDHYLTTQILDIAVKSNLIYRVSLSSIRYGFIVSVNLINAHSTDERVNIAYSEFASDRSSKDAWHAFLKKLRKTIYFLKQHYVLSHEVIAENDPPGVIKDVLDNLKDHRDFPSPSLCSKR